MRVNVEDSVYEHLPRLAKECGRTLTDALGQLVLVYRATQRAEVHEETPARLTTICALHFDSDEAADRFFTAMIAAQLAVLLDDGRIRIRGNGEHIARLNQYRDRASKGGNAKARKRNDFVASKQAPSKHQAATPLSTSVPSYAPSSFLLSPIQETNTNTGIVVSESQTNAVLTAPPSASAVAKKNRSPDQKTRSVAVNRRYRQRYEEREGHPPSGTDQAFNGAIAKFSDKHADNALAILDWFFDSPDPYFKRSGWAVQLLIDQAPRLWRELNNKRAAIENLAAPAQTRQLSLAANNELAYEEYLRRKEQGNG